MVSTPCPVLTSSKTVTRYEGSIPVCITSTGSWTHPWLQAAARYAGPE